MSRVKRIKKINLSIEKEWSNKFWNLIQDNLDKSWDWNYISSNPNITMDIIQENPDNPWDWSGISNNPNITIDFIKENIEKPLEWKYISLNPNITMDIIQENLNLPWNWEYITWNKNITINFIKKNVNKDWDWDGISELKFQKEKELFFKESYRKHIASYKIQQWWKEITMSPHYKIGRKFINRKYDNLFDL